MSVLIGCSPSTGSSLLRRILNRHPDVFCGSETSLFAKEELYTNWAKSKTKITRSSVFGLSSAGWHDFIGISLEEDYLWSKSEVKKLIREDAPDLNEFAHSFYRPILEREHKKVWAEKTPSNAFTLGLFLKSFPKGKVIHIVRNPLDTISSLHNRGMDLYSAVNVYLLNTAKALEVVDHPNAFLIKYEDLVDKPQEQLERLSEFLGVEYHDSMLEPSRDEGGVKKMEGWKHKETADVNSASVGRFAEGSDDLKQVILARIRLTEINLDLKHKSISELADTLGYSLPVKSTIPEGLISKLNSERKDDIRKRHFSRAYFRKDNYPIEISDGLA